MAAGSAVPLHHGQTFLLLHPHRSCLCCWGSGSSHTRLSSEMHVGSNKSSVFADTKLWIVQALCVWSHWSKPSVADCVPVLQCLYSDFCHVCVKRISYRFNIQVIYSNYIYNFYLLIFIEIHWFFYIYLHSLFYTELNNAHNKRLSMLHWWHHSIFFHA